MSPGAPWSKNFPMVPVFFIGWGQKHVSQISDWRKKNEGFVIFQATFRRDVEKAQTMVLEVAGDGPLRQLQLADGACKRFVAMKDKLLGNEHEARHVVLSSLRNFFRTLRNRYQGRLPNIQ